jgi:polysaccharide biosynthesis protein PslH
MKRVLYIDIPFMGINDGAASRSRFLWKSLIAQYEVDWLELQRADLPAAKEMPLGMDNHYTIQAAQNFGIFEPRMIYRYKSSEICHFKEILRKNNYDIIFFRFLSPAKLALPARSMCKTLIFDVDMLLSRLSRMTWKQFPKFKYRYYYLETKKLEYFEKKFFLEPYIFLFTNSYERSMINKELGVRAGDSLKVLPNVMEEKEYYETEKQQRILFFGSLSSSANADALQYLSENLYPLMEDELESRSIYLEVAGKGWHDRYKVFFENKKRLRYLGEVDNIQKEISKSLLVFLPLRIASGTRTRILEAANQAVPVVTTPIGAEGLDLSADEIMIESSNKVMLEKLFMLLNNEQMRKKMGYNLRQRCRNLYLEKNVSELLISQIEDFWKKNNA